MLQYHIFTHVFSTFVTFYHIYLLMLSLLFSLLSYHFKTYLYFKFKPLICFKICRLEKTKPVFDVKSSHLKESSNALMFFCFFKYLDLDPYFENGSGSRRPLNTNPDPKSCYLQVVGFLSWKNSILVRSGSRDPDPFESWLFIYLCSFIWIRPDNLEQILVKYYLYNLTSSLDKWLMLVITGSRSNAK